MKKHHSAAGPSEAGLLAELDQLWHEVRAAPERTARSAREAYDRARALGSKRAMAAALVVSGGAHSFMLRVAEAFSDLLEALSLANEADAPREAAGAYLRMAALNGSIGDFAAAFEDADKCVAAARRAGDAVLEAAAINNIGEIYRELGRHEDAVVQYERAMELSRAAGASRSMGLFVGNRGMALLSLGREAEALRDFAEAESLFRAYHVYPGLVELLVKRAGMAGARGDLFRAEAGFREALELAAAHSLAQCECDTLIEYGGWLASCERRAEAEAKLRRAADMARASRSRKLLARALRSLSRLAASRGEYRSAYIRAELADRMEKDLFNEDVRRRLAAFKVRCDLSWAERSPHAAKAESEALRVSNQRIQRSMELSRLVSRLGRAVASELDLADACRELHEGVKRFVDAPSFSLAVYEPETLSLRHRLVIEGGRQPDDSRNLLEDGDDPVARCFRQRAEIVDNGEDTRQGRRPPGDGRRPAGDGGARAGSVACFPVLAGADALGVMTVRSPRARAYDESALTVLRGLSLFVAVAIKNGLRYEADNARMEAEIYRLRNIELKAKSDELRKALDEVSEHARREKDYKDMILAWNRNLEDQVRLRTRELERLAMSDGLTGLYNRRHAFELLERELRAALRYGRALSILMVDIDDFKLVNDSFGHRAGDTALAEVARAIMASLRATDFAGRYGGEEFLVVLPETPAEGAVVLAERLREAIARLDTLGGVGNPITVSVGVAGLDGRMDSLSFVDVADRRLFEAKRLGKNRVVSS